MDFVGLSYCHLPLHLRGVAWSTHPMHSHMQTTITSFHNYMVDHSLFEHSRFGDLSSTFNWWSCDISSSWVGQFSCEKRFVGFKTSFFGSMLCDKLCVSTLVWRTTYFHGQGSSCMGTPRGLVSMDVNLQCMLWMLNNSEGIRPNIVMEEVFEKMVTITTMP